MRKKGVGVKKMGGKYKDVSVGKGRKKSGQHV